MKQKGVIIACNINISRTNNILIMWQKFIIFYM